MYESLKTLTIDDLIAKRKRAWASRQDIEYDADLVDAIARKILAVDSLVLEVKKRPYKLIEACFCIVDKRKKTVPFFLNKVQADFISKIEQYGTKKPYYILKGRQQGFTSLITAIQLSYAIVMRNFSGFTLADSSDNTRVIFNDKARMVYERLPDVLKPTERFNSVNELFFDKLNSSWRTAVATNNIGRSRTLNFVHFSELAFYDCSLASLQKAIGEAMTESAFCVYETTANGFNEAKDLWDSGICHNLFYGWWESAEYVSNEEIVLKDQWITARVKVLREMGLREEQIAWYVKKYNSYLDKNTIKQEYPTTADEAFVSSGESMFDKESLNNRIVSLAKEPSGRRGYFRYRIDAREVRDANGAVRDLEYSIEDIEFIEAVDGYIVLHEEPRVKLDYDGNVIKRCPYVLGGDTAGTGEDYFTAKVIDNMNGHTVATLHKQRMDEDIYTEQVICLAMYYHDALIGLETNFSRYPIKVLQKYRYPNIYIRKRVEGIVDKTDEVYGFETNSKTKPIIINNLVEMMRNDPTLECDIETLKEMITFARLPNGKMGAISGCHDDLVMAKAIAHFVSAQHTHRWQEVAPPERDVLQAFYENEDEDAFISWED